MYELLDFMHLT